MDHLRAGTQSPLDPGRLQVCPEVGRGRDAGTREVFQVRQRSVLSRARGRVCLTGRPQRARAEELEARPVPSEKGVTSGLPIDVCD